jgi:hypothetical protein
VVVEVEAAGAEVGADVARDDEGDVAGCSCGESSTWKHPGRGLDLLSSMGKLRGLRKFLVVRGRGRITRYAERTD